MLTSWFLVILAFFEVNQTHASGHTTCTANEDCVVDCHSKSCKGYTITATTALSLKISCSNSGKSPSNYCSGMTVYCPYSTTSTCHIDCNDYQCENTVINYPQPQNLYINCYGHDSCTSLQLLGPDTYSSTAINNNASIICSGTPRFYENSYHQRYTYYYGACRSAKFDLNYVANVDISCSDSYQNAHSTYSTNLDGYAACKSTTIYANYAHRVAITCGYNDCYSTYIYADHVTNDITLNCKTYMACHSLLISAKSANHLNVICHSYGTPYASCSSVTIYAPHHNANALTITCQGSNRDCDGISIHVTDDYVLNYMDVVSDSSTSVNSISIECDSRGTSGLSYNSFVQKYRCNGKPLCCPWKYGDYVCDNGHGDCVIDCTHLSDQDSIGCGNKVIDAVNATSLTVICDLNATTYGCESSTIFCPRNMVYKYGGANLSCSVQCLNEKSCSSSVIWGYENDYFNVLCNESLSCNHLEIKADSTHNANIKCNGNYTDRVDSSCKSLTLHVENNKESVHFECNGDYSCFEAAICANHSNIFNGVFIGTMALLDGSINAQYAHSFTMSCGTRYSVHKNGACYNTKLFGKRQDISYLNCESYGCSNVNLYSLNGISDWNITMNGCQECNGIDECVNKWNFYCGSSYGTSTYFDGNACHNTNCECTTSTFNKYLESSYDKYSCILEKANIICKENTNCNVICDNNTMCNHLAITASKSMSLTVHCNDASACSSTIIYCPFNDSTSCQINCNSEFGCNAMEIYTTNNSATLNCLKGDSCNTIEVYANYTNDLQVNCIVNNACNFITIHSEHANYLNLTCLGNFTDTIVDDSYASCSHLTIYSQYSKDLQWICLGSYVCSHNDIYVNNADIIVGTAFGDHALYYGHIYGLATNEFHLSCYADTSNNDTCYSSVIQSPAKSTIYPYPKKSFLNCYGTACHSLNLESDNGFDDWEININGCQSCNDVSTCIDYWYLTCSDGQDLTDHYVINYFYGDSCKFTGTNCQCSTEITTLNNLFTNDKSSCIYPEVGRPTPMPTSSPITAFPTHNPSIFPSESPIRRPTMSPIIHPTQNPIVSPTEIPTSSPSPRPTANPIKASLPPSPSPSRKPSITTMETKTISTTTSSMIVTSFTTAVLTNNNEGKGMDHDTSISFQMLIYIIIGMGAFIILLLLCGVITLCIYCKKKKKTEMDHLRLNEAVGSDRNRIEMQNKQTTTIKMSTKKAKSQKYAQLQD